MWRFPKTLRRVGQTREAQLALWESLEPEDPVAVLKNVRRLEIRTRRLVDQIFSGEYHSIFRGQGMEFHDVRPYVPGDDVRAIDWNVTARAGFPYVKTFVETRELVVLLMADISASSLFGTGGRAKRDLLAETAALVIFSALRNRDQVGLVLFSDRVEKVILPRKGRRHGLLLLRELLEARPRGQASGLYEPLETVGRLLRRRAVVFLMSDFLVPEPAQELHRIAARHDVIPVVLGDPREDRLPPMGLVELEDLETGRLHLVDTSDRRVRDAFARRSQRRRRELAHVFGRLGMDAVWLDTARDPVEALRRLFEMRMRRRARGGLLAGAGREDVP
ncbi:MAG: DUF58 domain-containing protein [Candidatus Eisenbacteria bacterium]|nr:DUF58 domain-containing protein [Candidatus Eisenbacteria bacterium]